MRKDAENYTYKIKTFFNNMSSDKYLVLFLASWVTTNEMGGDIFESAKLGSELFYFNLITTSLLGLFSVFVLYKRAKYVGHSWQFWVFAFIPKIRVFYYIYLLFAKSPQEKAQEAVFDSERGSILEQKPKSAFLLLGRYVIFILGTIIFLLFMAISFQWLKYGSL